MPDMQVDASTATIKFRDVCKDIVNSGYRLATIDGVRNPKPNIKFDNGMLVGIGLLKDRGPKEEQGRLSRLLRPLREREKADIVADLWFSPKGLRTDSAPFVLDSQGIKESNWIMIVHGQIHFEEMGNLARKLKSKKGVEILMLLSPKEEREKFKEDYEI